MKTSAVIEPVSKHTSQEQIGTFVKLITTHHNKISNRYIGVLAQVWKFNHTKSWVRSQYNQIYCIYPYGFSPNSASEKIEWGRDHLIIVYKCKHVLYKYFSPN
jgi:hypothetical protein